jgi:hypothetical protein
MNTTTFDIEIIPGKTIEATSNIDWSEGAPPFYCLPPSTEHCKPVARLNWGENMYGSLTEDFYLVVDDPKNESAFVLWVGDDGSQNDDHAARLCPAAWCEAVDLPDMSAKDTKAFVAAALLYAWVRATRGECLYRDEPPTVEATAAEDREAILEPDVTRIVGLALAREPYVAPAPRPPEAPDDRAIRITVPFTEPVDVIMRRIARRQRAKRAAEAKSTSKSTSKSQSKAKAKPSKARKPAKRARRTR